MKAGRQTLVLLALVGLAGLLGSLPVFAPSVRIWKLNKEEWMETGATSIAAVYNKPRGKSMDRLIKQAIERTHTTNSKRLPDPTHGAASYQSNMSTSGSGSSSPRSVLPLFEGGDDDSTIKVSHVTSPRLSGSEGRNLVGLLMRRVDDTNEQMADIENSAAPRQYNRPQLRARQAKR